MTAEEAICKTLCSVLQSVLFATVAPPDAGGGRVHVISLSMQSLAPSQDDSGGDGDEDEFGPNHCVCVTTASSSLCPEDDTDHLVRRLAMDAVWCTQLRIDPQIDLGVQAFDEKVRKLPCRRGSTRDRLGVFIINAFIASTITTSYQNISSLFYFQSDLCPIPPPLSTYRSRLDVLSVTVVRATGLYSSSSPYVTLELSSPPMSAISAAGIGRQKRETVRPPSISCMLTDQLQSCTVATWNQQFQL